MKKIAGVLGFFLVIQFAAGQNTKWTSWAEETLLDEQQHLNYIRFKETYRVNESEVVAFINSMIFASGRNEVYILNTERDNIGFTHLRFNIRQNKAHVANKMIIAHCRQGKLVSLNGDFNDIDVPAAGFTLAEDDALKFALDKVHAKTYKWQNKAEERHMRQALDQPAFTYYPHGSKVIIEKGGKTHSAWMFNIYAEEPLYRANVFVDASNGKILDEQNLICHLDVPGTAITKYSGTQTITCDQNGVQFSLKETSRGLGIETYNLNGGSNYNASTSFTSTTANFNLSTFDKGALDAHWGAEKTYDYYLSQHNRNSIDNAGFKLVSYVHYNTNYSNAFWDGQRMTYGDGSGSTDIYTCLDVCGHEISHGLTSNTSNLNYSYESGALNESYSDIFGACVERYARPTNWSWKLGEDMTSSGNGNRNMSNPNLFSDPDTYGGTYWYTGAGDNGGVHTNSGVSNFWFYLLTTGGTGTNDISNAYNVVGLGVTNAAKIAFRALTVYYTPTTNFATARNLSIQAAKDLFGDCSNEMQQTMNAWHAVGVGAAYVAGLILPNFKAGFTKFCTLPATISFSNTTANALTYSWDFGDGSALVTSTNAVHTYTANGNYNVKLKAVECSSAADSITKNAFVAIDVPLPPVVTSNVTSCENAPAVLSATGSDVIKWYSGPATTFVAGTGSIFTTPNLASGTTYYAANTVPGIPATGGMLSNTGGGNSTNNVAWLVFDVVEPGTLNSVVAYASTVGTRTIELYDAFDVLINSVAINFTTTGATTLTLNFPLAVGSNYSLRLANGSPVNLYRSTAGVYYPYYVGSCVSIVGSSNANGYYYWFYKWNVTRDDCTSPLVPVAITLDPCTGLHEKAAFAGSIEVFPNPAKENITVKTNALQEGNSVSITDATGRVVYHSVMMSHEEKIDLGNFSNGLYFLSVKNSSGKTVKTVKVVKD